MTSPIVSVLIPSHNSKKTLIPCIEHFAAQTLPANRFEVIVILDGSTDGSREALETMKTGFKLKIAEQRQQGKATALNNGAELAEGEIIAVVDSDILVVEKFLEAHIQAHGQADVVIGPIPLSPVSPRNFMTDNVRVWAEDHARNMRAHSGELSSTNLYGANLSISRALFKKLGGYRTDLRRTEDFHFGEKIICAGLKVHYCPEAIAGQIYDKTFPAWCDDFYRDGQSQVGLVAEFPYLKDKLKLGRYHHQTFTKRLFRPLVMHDHPIGKGLVALGKIGLEWARKSGRRWRFLSDVQGLLGDAIYWKGVYDAIGDQDRFMQFVQAQNLSETKL